MTGVNKDVDAVAIESQTGRLRPKATGYNVANLVTKEMCYNKPKFDDLVSALVSLKAQIAAKKITKLAMPQIGCGLDKLKWADVSAAIKEIFANDNVDIHIWIYDK